MSVAQIAALIIFVIMFVLIVMDKIERQWVTLVSGLVTLVVVFGIIMHDAGAVWDVINFKSLAKLGFWIGEAPEAPGGIDWATIIFLGGMMIMVEGMAKSGFFRWLCMRLAKMVNYKTIPLFLTFMVASAVLAMFIDSITVILFLAAVTFELARLLKFNPIPMILSEVFCANLGGSATMCGDPPNIIIGSQIPSLGGFVGFLTHTGPIAGICLVVVVIFFYLVYRKQLLSSSEAIDLTSMPDPKEAIKNQKDFVLSIIIFAIAIVLLVSHSATEISVATIGVTVAILTVIFNFKDLKIVMAKVDYKILLFFIGLFVVVGGLEKTEVLTLIAEFIQNVSGGNPYVMIAIIIWVSAIASAFVDNIPFAATMVPVIKTLSSTTGVPIATLAWTLAMGTDIGGAATPIGASANVVGTTTAEKNGYKISWATYCKASAPAMVIVITISMLLIFAFYC